MVCGYCNEEYPAGYRFCQTCGTAPMNADELLLASAFRQMTSTRAPLALREHRTHCPETNSSHLPEETTSETLLLVDAFLVISSVARATSQSITERHGRLAKLIGQAVDPARFNTYSIEVCSGLISGSNDKPTDSLWNPVILRTLALYDEQNGSDYADLPRRGFQLLVLVAAALSTGAEERQQVIKRYKLLLGGNANGAEESADESALQAYEILGVPPTCTDKELTTAYHKKATYWHPDKFNAIDIPREMKELATREMARVNDAYNFLGKLRSAATPPNFVENHERKTAADPPKRDDKRAGGQTESVPPPSSTYSSSHDPKPGSDGEAFMNNSHQEYDMTGRPVRSEQESFYKTVNRVAEDNSTTIKVGVAYAKYSFWRAVFTSKPGQFIIMAILAGICWIVGANNGAKIILATVITIVVWIILTLAVGVIGGAIAGWKNPGGEHARIKIGFIPTLLIWVAVFLCLTFIINTSPEETAPDTQPLTQEATPAPAPVPTTSVVPEPTASDPATATPADRSQTIEPTPASNTDEISSRPHADVNGSTSPSEKTETGFQSCAQFNGQAYTDCMKPYR